VLRDFYERESTYQRRRDPDRAPTRDVDLSVPSQWKQHLAKDEYYSTFLEHFEREMDTHGYEKVVHDTLFSGTEVAEDMFQRLYAGFMHPLIHVGYGLEFKQPAIVAEGLAMTAMSRTWMGEVLVKVEQEAESVKFDETKTLISLLEEMRKNEKLFYEGPGWEDRSQIEDIVVRTTGEVSQNLKQFRVPVEHLSRKAAESINITGLFTAATQRPDKEIKMDFFYMHSHNSSMFLPTFLSQPWISDASKVRLLEWKVRFDLALYASRRPVPLRIEEVQNYACKEKDASNPWLSILDRALRIKDDGHSAKFIRACAHGAKFCRPWEDRPEFVMKSDMWMKMALMCVDSIGERDATEGGNWRFDENFRDCEPRKKL